MLTCSRRQVCSGARAMVVTALAIVIATGCHRPRDRAARIYVSNENAGTVSVIDASSHTTIATIPVGKRPRGLRVSPDGRTLYVALSGSPKAGPGVDESTLPPPDRSADGIGVVDLTTLKLVETIPSGQDPESFDLAGEHFLVVSNEDAAQATIVDVRAKQLYGKVSVGGEPEGVTTAPDGLVWVTNEGDNTVSVIDPGRSRVVATIATGIRPRSIAFNHRLGVITGENDASLTLVDFRARTVVGRIELPTTGAMPPRPMGVAIDREGRYAYVTTGRAGSVAAVDLDAREVVRMIEDVGKRPWGITLGRDGLLYTANGPSDDVAVIDPEAGRVVRHIPSGGSPWGVTSI